MRKKEDTKFRTMIGGQALIEGIMMRGPDKQAIVCRTGEGLVSKVEDLKSAKDKNKLLTLPFIRGVYNFGSSMFSGVKAVTWSADQLPEDEQEEPGKLDLWIEEKFGWEKAQKIVIAAAVVLGIALSVGLFILLPTLLAGWILPSGSGGETVVIPVVVRNLLEGALRIAIFLLYLWGVTHMKDIKRMFGYHGAEHKTIFCYEKKLELTVENVRIQPRQHPRCGTSFLFVVMIVSILVFSVVRWSNMWIRMGLRLLLLPVVVGISYEINRWVGRHDNLFTSILSWPGRKLQNLTTNEPDDSMIEVAIEALKLVIPEEQGADKW